jgi:5-methylcytosine-specific restriction endonuclease McrA
VGRHKRKGKKAQRWREQRRRAKQFKRQQKLYAAKPFEQRLDVRWIEPNTPAHTEYLCSLPYKEYLESDHWLKLRELCLIRSRYHCENCRTNKTTLHVHHITYDNKGNEKPEDLVVLCRICHKLQHQERPPPLPSQLNMATP